MMFVGDVQELGVDVAFAFENRWIIFPLLLVMSWSSWIVTANPFEAFVVTLSCCPSSLWVCGEIVPNGSVVDVSLPVVVALFKSVVDVARGETVNVNVVAIAAVTLTPFTMAIRVSAEFDDALTRMI